MIHQATYDVVLETNSMIPMRDGVRLATDIFYPARNGAFVGGKWPALLYRTPYQKSAVGRQFKDFRYFAGQGYIVLLQDIRGCYESEGDFDFMLPDAEDGYDTLEWIDRQPWTNGKVGSWGVSWCAWSQTAMAALGPKNLTCMIPAQSGADAYSASVRQGGAMELRWLAWLIWHAANNTQKSLKERPFVDPALNLGAPAVKEVLARMPIRRGGTQLKLTPKYEDWFLKLQCDGDRLGFWDQPALAPAKYVGNFPNCTTVFVGGWYDSYAGSVFENYNALADAGKGPVRVVVGPWCHGTMAHQNSFAGNVDFGADAAMRDFADWHLSIFDWAMKGSQLRYLTGAPIRLFVMGGGSGERTAEGRLAHGGRWRDEDYWPLRRTSFTPYYLHEDGLLSTEPPSAEGGETTYNFNPSDPVPTIGGSVSSLCDNAPLERGIANPAYSGVVARRSAICPGGGFDQSERPSASQGAAPYLPLRMRQDVIVFETDPLQVDMEVTGPIVVKLWVSTTAPDTDFTAKLIDSYPPSEWYPFGYDLNITDGIQRLRYRHGDGKAKFLPQGEIAEIAIRLYPTSNLFVRGHRIRLDISSSNFPRFDVNPNTGGPMGRERRKRIAENTIHHNKVYASHIVLPIIAA